MFKRKDNKNKDDKNGRRRCSCSTDTPSVQCVVTPPSSPIHIIRPVRGIVSVRTPGNWQAFIFLLPNATDSGVVDLYTRRDPPTPFPPVRVCWNNTLTPSIVYRRLNPTTGEIVSQQEGGTPFDNIPQLVGISFDVCGTVMDVYHTLSEVQLARFTDAELPSMMFVQGQPALSGVKTSQRPPCNVLPTGDRFSTSSAAATIPRPTPNMLQQTKKQGF